MMSRMIQPGEVEAARSACGLAWDAVAHFRSIGSPTVDDLVALSVALRLQAFDVHMLTLGFEERMAAKGKRKTLANEAAVKRGGAVTEGKTGKRPALPSETGAQQSWIAEWEKKHDAETVRHGDAETAG